MLTGDVDWPLTKKSLNSAPLTFYLKKNLFQRKLFKLDEKMSQNSKSIVASGYIFPTKSSLKSLKREPKCSHCSVQFKNDVNKRQKVTFER